VLIAAANAAGSLREVVRTAQLSTPLAPIADMLMLRSPD